MNHETCHHGDITKGPSSIGWRGVHAKVPGQEARGKGIQSFTQKVGRLIQRVGRFYWAILKGGFGLLILPRICLEKSKLGLKRVG